MKAETKPITVRLLKRMIDAMDKQIEKYELYANKPDFIVWMMREYYNYILYAIGRSHRIYEKMDKNDPKYAGINEITFMQYLIFDANPSMGLWNEKDGSVIYGKPILIRIPLGLYKNIISLNESLGSPYRTIQDFCRFAVTVGIENEWDRGSVFDDFMKLSKKPNDKELIKKLIDKHSPKYTSDWSQHTHRPFDSDEDMTEDEYDDASLEVMLLTREAYRRI